MIKKCTVCKEEKSFEAFYNRVASEDGKAYRCKECDEKAGRIYREKHKEYVKKRQRNSRIKYRFGITSEQYNQMVKDQNGLCAVCLKEPIPTKQHDRLVIDHDHQTGKIRGLLCHKCNQALGLFKDNIETLRNAITYLEK